MTPRTRRLQDGRLWFVAAALLALPLCLDATGDPDIWWHLRTGQWIADHLSIPHAELFSYTAPGAPWITHEWLAELSFWLLQRGIGLAGLALVVGATTWSGLLALALLARHRGGSGIAAGLVLLLGAKALQPITGTRPQMLTFALLCWTLLLLETHHRRGGRRIWLLVPTFLLWANLHAGFVIGLGILALGAFGELLDVLWQRQWDAPQRRRFTLTGAVLVTCAAVALINPNGWRLYQFALSGSTPAAHRLIQEWQHPDFTSPAMTPLALLLVLTGAAMLLQRHRLRPSHLLMATVGAAAALIAVRNIAITVALLSPILAELVPLRYRLPSRPFALPLIAVGAGVAALAASVLALNAAATTSAIAQTMPACLVSDAAALAQPVRLWTPYGQGGFAIDAAWPLVHVYAYGEDATLGQAVINSYVRIAAGATVSPSALDLLRTSRTTAVITPTGALATELGAAGWHAVAASHGEILYTDGVVGSVPCPG